MAILPTADQLERLTLRALAVYAERAARRDSVALHRVIDESIVEAPLHILQKVASIRELDWADSVAAPLAASRVLKATAALEAPEMKVAAVCLTSAARAAMNLLHAARSGTNVDKARYYRRRAAGAAARVADWAAHVLDGEAAARANDAAAHDYEVLMKTCGQHEDVVLGDPIDLSDERWAVRSRPDL